MIHSILKKITIVFLFISTIACSEEEVIIIETDENTITEARYIDSVNGDDDNDGTSELKAWKSLSKINEIEWGSGASILLKSGSQWHGQFDLKGSGSQSQPILLSNYGEGPAPIISGVGRNYTFRIMNEQFWQIENLEITNFHEPEEGIGLEEWENYNKTHWAEGTGLAQYEAYRTNKSAILILGEDIGEINHLHFKNLEVHGVNGDISDKNNGGIFFEITGNIRPTWFNDVLIEDCYIHDVDRTGISNQSSWSERSLTANVSWMPSKNIVIRNNVFERTGANALIVRVANAPLMEYNLFDHCAIKESGNASFSFNCDNALWQYNEARFTKYNQGDQDAGGFDSDYRSKNTTIRYNYSHDNEFGAILVCCQGGSTRFNVGTRVYYNIFANNEHHVIRVSGTPDNTVFHNNIIYNSDDAHDADMIWHKSWVGYPSNTSYVNNIFFSRNSNLDTDLGSSTSNYFESNLFWGNFSGEIPSDRLQEDPLFVGANYNGTPLPEFFQIQQNSPAKNAGAPIANSPQKDFFGNIIQDFSELDIGVHELNSK